MEKKTLYRICTEDVNPEDTRRLIEKRFDGYTLLHGEGCWKGGEERALVIEIVTNNYRKNAENITALCRDLKDANNQNAVLVECVEIDTFLV